MKLAGQFLFMGTEKTESQDGKKYFYKVGLMQGLESKKFYVDQVTFERYQNIPIATQVDADIDIKEGKEGKVFFELCEVQVLSAKDKMQKIG